MVSRPIHVKVIGAVNADREISPEANADFHVMLTATMDDVKALYHLPQ